jgi:hypothetical protein
MTSGPSADTPKKQRRLERWKDRATIFSSVVAASALLFTAYQFYLGRKALQSQTILSATNNATQLQSEIIKNPNLYSNVFGVSADKLSEEIAARQIIAFYVSRYYEHESGILPDDAWKPIASEICTMKSLPKIAPRLVPSQYPQGFDDILKTCPDP